MSDQTPNDPWLALADDIIAADEAGKIRGDEGRLTRNLRGWCERVKAELPVVGVPDLYGGRQYGFKFDETASQLS